MLVKTKAIIAHVTPLGWLVALAFYLLGDRSPLLRFYLRQVLGLILAWLVINLIFIKGLATLLTLGVLVLGVYSLVGAIKGEEVELPKIGSYFQRWFSFI